MTADKTKTQETTELAGDGTHKRRTEWPEPFTDGLTDAEVSQGYKRLGKKSDDEA